MLLVIAVLPLNADEVTFTADPIIPELYALEGSSSSESAIFTEVAVHAVSDSNTSVMVGDAGIIEAAWIDSQIGNNLITAAYDPVSNTWGSAVLVLGNVTGPLYSIGNGSGGNALACVVNDNFTLITRFASDSIWSIYQQLGTIDDPILDMDLNVISVTGTSSQGEAINNSVSLAEVAFIPDPDTTGLYSLVGSYGADSAIFTEVTVEAESSSNSSFMQGESGIIHACWIASDIGENLVITIYDYEINSWGEAQLVIRDVQGPLYSIGTGSGVHAVAFINGATGNLVVMTRLTASDAWSEPIELEVINNPILTIDATALIVTGTNIEGDPVNDIIPL